MLSLRDFVDEINTCDKKHQLLEEWIHRKENEFKSRVSMPPKHMQKSDKELNSEIDGQLKKAREMLVTKFIGKKDSKYNDLSPSDLSQICESIVVRLHLFKGNYPAFMPQVVRGVMEHPKLLKTDYQKVNTFAKMFELDWRGDVSIQNKNQFLATNPVYLNQESNFNSYGTIGNFEVTKMLQNACAPFVGKIKEEMEKCDK